MVAHDTMNTSSAAPDDGAGKAQRAMGVILMVLACAIPLRPFFKIFGNDEKSVLIEFAINFAAWALVVILYGKTTGRSLKRWWVYASGLLSWISLLAILSIIYTVPFTKATWLLAEKYEAFKVIILYFPWACSALALFFALRSRGVRKFLFYTASVSIIIATAPPLFWMLGFILFRGWPLR